MKHRLLLTITACCALFGACKEGAKTAPKEETLYETLEVSLSDRTLTTGYAATISGVQTVEIRPQVSGMITEIMIEEVLTLKARPTAEELTFVLTRPALKRQ